VPFVPHDAALWVAQAPLQHTPFDPQTPVVQSVPPIAGLHPWPGKPFPTHTPLAQWFPLEHCVFAVQDVAHTLPLHTYAPHDAVMDPVQLPFPSHSPAVFAIPFVHEAAKHVVLVPHFSHTPLLHFPSSPQLASVVALQMTRGSVAPFFALPQAPFCPPVSAAEQAWQAPLQGESQQKPSTQNPDVHTPAYRHVDPCGAPLPMGPSKELSCPASAPPEPLPPPTPLTPPVPVEPRPEPAEIPLVPLGCPVLADSNWRVVCAHASRLVAARTSTDPILLPRLMTTPRAAFVTSI
jgi:hypothetical protein